MNSPDELSINTDGVKWIMHVMERDAAADPAPYIRQLIDCAVLANLSRGAANPIIPFERLVRGSGMTLTRPLATLSGSEPHGSFSVSTPESRNLRITFRASTEQLDRFVRRCDVSTAPSATERMDTFTWERLKAGVRRRRAQEERLKEEKEKEEREKKEKEEREKEQREKEQREKEQEEKKQREKEQREEKEKALKLRALESQKRGYEEKVAVLRRQMETLTAHVDELGKQMEDITGPNMPSTDKKETNQSAQDENTDPNPPRTEKEETNISNNSAQVTSSGRRKARRRAKNANAAKKDAQVSPAVAAVPQTPPIPLPRTRFPPPQVPPPQVPPPSDSKAVGNFGNATSVNAAKPHPLLAGTVCFVCGGVPHMKIKCGSLAQCAAAGRCSCTRGVPTIICDPCFTAWQVDMDEARKAAEASAEEDRRLGLERGMVGRAVEVERRCLNILLDIGSKKRDGNQLASIDLLEMCSMALMFNSNHCRAAGETGALPRGRRSVLFTPPELDRITQFNRALDKIKEEQEQKQRNREEEEKEEAETGEEGATC